jgi:hypothetical protein
MKVLVLCSGMTVMCMDEGCQGNPMTSMHGRKGDRRLSEEGDDNKYSRI